jgi:hypothetical protein
LPGCLTAAVQEIVRFRCAVDASTQGLHHQWVPGLNRRSPQCPADLLLSDHSLHRSFALAQANLLHSRALRLPLPDILLSIRPFMPRHRHSVSCTSSNSNGDRSSKGLAGLLQSSGLHRAFPLNPQAHATWRCQRQGRTRPAAPPSNHNLWWGRSSASLELAASRP